MAKCILREDYHIVQTIRCTGPQDTPRFQRRKIGKKPRFTMATPLPPQPASQVTSIRTIRCTPFSSQIWGQESVSYSLKNTVVYFLLLMGGKCQTQGTFSKSQFYYYNLSFLLSNYPSAQIEGLQITLSLEIYRKPPPTQLFQACLVICSCLKISTKLTF